MATRHRPAIGPRHFVFPILTIAVLVYFGFHAFHGEYGLIAEARLKARAQNLSAVLETLEDERGVLEKRVTLLRPESLDPDMIDEQARQILHVAHPDEVLIYRN
ncbi:MAG: septum formation initiator family protein [Pseudomonadota bacterium]